MHLKAATLDDLLHEVFRALLKSKVFLKATKGPNAELTGVVLELTKPRSRLSRTESKGTIFSCLGELIWYLSTSNQLDFVKHYIPRYDRFAEPDDTIWGAYGPRIFGGDPSQYETVKGLLEKKPTSRQAVIQLFDQDDIASQHKDTPCTCTIQFLVRSKFLHMIVHMRSNDAYLGLPHDIFAFTMIQEMLANDLGYKLGTYKHMVGSLHLYDDSRGAAQSFLDEGFQTTREMPPMSEGSPWVDIPALLKIEHSLRSKGPDAVDDALIAAQKLSKYWGDVARLLAIFTLTKGFKGPDPDRLRKVLAISSENDPYFETYIRRRSKALTPEPIQLPLIHA